jgi:hypothetical protein
MSQEWFAARNAIMNNLSDSIAEERQSEIFTGRI